MNADLVARVRNRLHLLGESLDRVAGDEPSSLDAEPIEQLQQASASYLSGEEAARNVTRRILVAVGAEPARDSVNLDAKSDAAFFRHGTFSSRCCAAYPSR